MLYITKNFILFAVIFILSFSNIVKTEASTELNQWATSFESYLFNLGPITGKFSQLDKYGKLSKGKFWSNGKGSIKFSYLPESELMITINDGLISVKEKENSPVNQYSIKDSPISNLLSKNFSLDNFAFKKITIGGNIGTIELRIKESSKRNSIHLTGDYPIPKLRQWRLIDAQNNETLVFFSKISKFDFLDENFFNMNYEQK